MSDAATENLVNEVVRRVLASMAPSGPPPAEAADPARSPVAPATAPPASGARVWVTEQVLADRAGGSASVSLAPNEHLTPAARDYAAGRGIEVVQSPAGATEAVTTATAGRVHPAVLTRTLGLVVNRPDPKVESALAAVARGGVSTVGFADSTCWMVNTRAMCDAINAGQLAGGVIVDRYAAAPMALAGKVRGIRSVQGVSVAAVLAALRQFDANVLVVGHTTASVYEIRSMVDRFAAGRRMGRERTSLLEAMEQLEAEM